MYRGRPPESRSGRKKKTALWAGSHGHIPATYPQARPPPAPPFVMVQPGFRLGSLAEIAQGLPPLGVPHRYVRTYSSINRGMSCVSGGVCSSVSILRTNYVRSRDRASLQQNRMCLVRGVQYARPKGAFEAPLRVHLSGLCYWFTTSHYGLTAGSPRPPGSRYTRRR